MLGVGGRWEAEGEIRAKGSEQTGRDNQRGEDTVCPDPEEPSPTPQHLQKDQHRTQRSLPGPSHCGLHDPKGHATRLGDTQPLTWGSLARLHGTGPPRRCPEAPGSAGVVLLALLSTRDRHSPGSRRTIFAARQLQAAAIQCIFDDCYYSHLYS